MLLISLISCIIGIRAWAVRVYTKRFDNKFVLFKIVKLKLNIH